MKKLLIIWLVLLFSSTCYGWSSNDYTTEDKAKVDLLTLTGGTTGDVLTLQSDGSWSPAAPGTATMVYPGAGIAVSTGSAWDTSITNNSANWNTAYGWGDHASAGYVTGTPWTAEGYLTAETDPSALKAADIGTTVQAYSANMDTDYTDDFDGTYASLSGAPTIPAISDTAYDATSWDGNTDGATKNAIRDKIETLPGGHAAVTLSALLDSNLFSLSTQELGLDTQTANYVFAGPASGEAAAPAFRALTADDIPALSYAAPLGPDDNYVTNAEKAAFHAAGSDAETSASIEDIMTGADAVTTVGDTDTVSIVVGGVLKKITGANAKSEFGGGGATTGYIDFPCPIMADNTGASITSDVSSPLNGQSLFSDSADTAANYIRYPAITVPADFDSATDLTATFKIVLANSDGLLHRYTISMCNVADSSGVVSPTFINPINLDFAGDASGAQYDVETIGPVTLTDWKTSLTAGDTLIIKVARDGDDETNDSSVVDSYSYGLLITYGK